MWILMEQQLSIEALFALWLVRRFSVSELSKFRDARIIYYGGEGKITPQRLGPVLALTQGCLIQSGLFEELKIPRGICDIIEDLRYGIQYDSRPWSDEATRKKLEGAPRRVIPSFFELFDVVLRESRNEQRRVPCWRSLGE